MSQDALIGARAPSGPVPSGRPARKPGGKPAVRLTGSTFVVLLAITGLVAIYATDQVVPATSLRQADLRIWLASRAAGFMTLGLLTVQVALGLVLSHPYNKTTWKLSKRLFPWHENLWVFVLAFLAIHIVATIADQYANVGILGTFIPGLSQYRSTPVALGTMALYALLITGATARYTKLLPAGAWLQIHRLAIVVFVLSWMHGLLAGTDSVAVGLGYTVAFAVVLAAAAYRYWVSRTPRPTFSTSLPEVTDR